MSYHRTGCRDIVRSQRLPEVTRKGKRLENEKGYIRSASALGSDAVRVFFCTGRNNPVFRHKHYFDLENKLGMEEGMNTLQAITVTAGGKRG